MRDTIRNREYFNGAIEFNEKIISRDQVKVYDLPQPTGRALMLRNLCSYSVELCCQRYSRGDSFTEIRSGIEQMLQMFRLRGEMLPTLNLDSNQRKMWDQLTFEKYWDNLICLAFAVSQRCPSETYHKLLAHIGHPSEDRLLDRIAQQLGDTQRHLADSILFGKAYGALLTIIEAEPEQKPTLMNMYIGNWYKKHMRGTLLIDSDKNDNYVGYWCFEAALVVMLYDIDDASFCDHPHYPVDLVRHYQRSV